MKISVIDLRADRNEVARQIGEACKQCGFFYVIGHGVDETLQERLEEASRRFFAQDLKTKLEIEMARGGRAWRGYFPVGGELTSGQPDLKEGIYFGEELPNDHPLVQAETPLHGPNLFPSAIPELRELVLEYLEAMTQLGHRLMAAISLSFGLDESYFEREYTSNPLILFRIFNYPTLAASGFGVGEHTDYGLLTMLKQDDSGGLQIKVQSNWVDADPIRNSFVCNVGDMIERLTRGRYRSAPHRVRNITGRSRLSFAFFFDPNFNAEMKPVLADAPVVENTDERWDHASVHDFSGTYGDYLLGKVSKVFPELRRKVL
jgi:isopenicillin N synthase-like dioxygenase